MTKLPDITVVICTRNRASSLLETLRSLDAADPGGLQVELVVVDNNSEDNTEEAVKAFSTKLPFRYLTEPQPGKGHCLNRALDGAPLGEVVAFLDDDILVPPDWFRAVMDACQRHPDFDIFGGQIRVVLPAEETPNWILRGGVKWWALSGVDRGNEDVEIRSMDWPGGGHFWIRSRVFDKETRFNHLWLTEPDLFVRLTNRGCRGMWIGAARAEHHVQPGLLSVASLRRRAATLGRNLAHVHGYIPDQGLKSTLRGKHPLLWLTLSLGNLFRHMAVYASSYALPGKDARIERQLTTIMAMSKNAECVRMGLRSCWPRR